MELSEICPKCGKRITDEEYVVNWGTCSDCLNKSYEEYLKRKEDGNKSCDPGVRF